VSYAFPVWRRRASLRTVTRNFPVPRRAVRAAASLRRSIARRRVMLVLGSIVLCAAAVTLGIGAFGWRQEVPGPRLFELLAHGSLVAAGLGLIVWAWLRQGDERALLTELDTREQELVLSLAQLPAIVWTTDTELRLTSVFGALNLRLENPRARATGHTLYEIFGTDPTHPVIAAHRRALQGESATYERVAGDAFIEGAVEPLRDERGRLIGCVGVAMNVTTARLAQSQARRYVDLVESSLDAIISTDLDGVVDGWNPAAERLYGYARHEMVGRPISLIEPPDREGETTALRERLIHGDLQGPYETVRRRRDGTLVEVSAHLSPVRDRDGRLTGVSTVQRDYSARARAETALRVSEARFRAIYERAPLGVALIDSFTGRFLEVNSKYCEIVGRSQREMLETDFQSLTHPDDLQPDLDNMQRLIEGKCSFFDMTKRYLRPDGSIIWVYLAVVPMWAEGEPPSSHIAIVENITERRRAEESLLRSQQELRGLARRLESVREEEHVLIARVIHDELSQALTALHLDLAWIAQRLPARSDALRGKVDEMSALTATTIEAGRCLVAELRPSILDDLGLVPALEWYVELFGSRTNVRTQLDVGAVPPAVSGPVAVTAYRIVQEALTNVARHAEATRVTVRLGKPDGALLLEITDDGKGMPADLVSSTRSFGIVGMRERLLAHGGSFEIGDAPGGGTLVRATIPLGQSGEHGEQE
jgi:two-component system sensor histidine kinase UhpB